MALPPKPILMAIMRWLPLAKDFGWVQARSRLLNLPRYSDLTQTQYEEARTWILNNLSENPKDFPDKKLEAFLLVAEASDPLWLKDAESLIASVTELPEDALSLAECFGIDGVAAVGSLRQLGRKINLARLKKIGDIGELAILKLLRQEGFSANHVALESDSLGYDIAARLGNSEAYFEVKTSTRSNRAILYLSRNEYEVMQWLEDWKLLLVLLDGGDRASHFFEVDQEWLKTASPQDRHTYSRWENARFEVPPDMLTPGIRSIQPSVNDYTSPLLTGIFK